MAADVIKPTRKNVTIRGQGCAQGYELGNAGTQLIAGAGTTLIDLTDPAGNYGCLQDFSIRCPVGQQSLCYEGIKARNHQFITRLEVAGFWDGIRLHDYTNQSRLEHVSSTYNTRTGLLVGGDGVTNVTIFSVEHCSFRQNLVGVLINNGRHFAFRDCVMESNTNEGIYLNALQTITHGLFECCHVENNWLGLVGYGIVLDGSTHCQFRNMAVSGAKAIRVNATETLFDRLEVFNNAAVDVQSGAVNTEFRKRTGGTLNNQGTGTIDG